MMLSLHSLLPAGRLRRLALVIGLSMGLPHAAIAQEGPPGITRPVVFPPFDPNAAACTPPAGLRKVLAFAQDNERKFMQGVAHGLQLAAKDRGLAYELAQANNDAATMMGNIRNFLNSKVGALVVSPVDAPSLSPLLNRSFGPARMWARWFRRLQSRC